MNDETQLAQYELTIAQLRAENEKLREERDTAQAIVKYVSSSREGMVILCKMVCAELNKVGMAIADAVARCEQNRIYKQDDQS